MRPAAAVFGTALVIAALLPPAAARAQVLSMTEIDGSGNRHPIDAVRRRGIVDINGSILLGIEKDSLRRRFASPLTTSAMAGFNALAQIAAQGMEASQAFGTAMTAYVRDPSTDALTQAAKKMSPLLQKLDSLAAADPELATRIQAATDSIQPGMSMADIIGRVFTVVSRVAQQRRGAADALLSTAGFYVEMGAWHVAGGRQDAIHLDGFDTIRARAPVDISRWSLALSADQVAALKHMAETARTSRDAGFQTALLLPPAVRTTLVDLSAAADSCASAVQQRLLPALTKVPPDLQLPVDSVAESLSVFRGVVAAAKARYSGSPSTPADSTSFLVGATADLTNLVGAATRVLAGLQRLPEMAPQMREAVTDAVVSRARSCGARFDQVKAAAENVRGVAATLVGTRSAADAVLTFGDKVLRLDIASLPDSTELPLRDVGSRDPGDLLVVKLAAGDAGQAPRTLSQYQVTMERIAMYVHSRIGIAFADPHTTTLPSRFQPAASYSYIMTWGSRSSEAYDSLLRFGIAANLSALDFNRDGTPELGLGGGLSVLNGIGEIGMGFDVPRSERFWYFSVNLAAPAAVLGGS